MKWAQTLAVSALLSLMSPLNPPLAAQSNGDMLRTLVSAFDVPFGQTVDELSKYPVDPSDCSRARGELTCTSSLPIDSRTVCRGVAAAHGLVYIVEWADRGQGMDRYDVTINCNGVRTVFLADQSSGEFEFSMTQYRRSDGRRLYHKVL